MTRRRSKDAGIEGEGRPRIDTALVLLILLAIAVVLFLTFDLWTPHAGFEHR